MIDSTTPITEEWLKSAGFKWHEMPRQHNKHWLLWLGDTIEDACFEDLGIEISSATYAGHTGYINNPGKWFCWLRADYGGRYSRFLHVRHVYFVEEIIQIVEGITGQPWDPANNLYGSMRKPDLAARLREESERLDRRMLKDRPWREIEKDDTRGRALPEHLEAYEKAGLKDRDDL